MASVRARDESTIPARIISLSSDLLLSSRCDGLDQYSTAAASFLPPPFRTFPLTVSVSVSPLAENPLLIYYANGVEEREKTEGDETCTFFHLAARLGYDDTNLENFKRGARA